MSKLDRKALDSVLLEELVSPDGFCCDCGKHHQAKIDSLKIGPGVIEELTDALHRLRSSHPMVVCGPNGYDAAGKTVCRLLDADGIPYSLHRLPEKNGKRIKPAEYEAGRLLLRFDHECDLVLGVGSGVINDLCKVLSTAAKVPYMIVATAPSMDGYASDSASVEVGNIKLSLPEKMPAAILCDTQIMSNAPTHMILAGMGDILAKYTSILDWKLSHLVTGEYYCDSVASLVVKSRNRTVSMAEGIRENREETVRFITEGLVLSGISIAFAGCSHPASGLEHYFSHCWEMMSLERGKDYELHGIQVGIGMLLTLKIVEYLKGLHPTMKHAEAAADRFSEKEWAENIRRVFPSAAEGILEMEETARKNARDARLVRAEKAIRHWDEIVSLFEAELPSYDAVKSLMLQLGMPTTPGKIGVTNEEVLDAFICSRDIRNKYLLSSMIWDLGYTDEVAAMLRKSL